MRLLEIAKNLPPRGRPGRGFRFDEVLAEIVDAEGQETADHIRELVIGDKHSPRDVAYMLMEAGYGISETALYAWRRRNCPRKPASEPTGRKGR